MRGVILVFMLVLLTGCIMIVEEGSIETNTISQQPDIVEYELGGDNMKLVSDAFNSEEMIPKKYSCQGEDVNPDLKWDDVPADVKSFALIVDDPDAPNGNWVHWLVKDIPADVRIVEEDSVPGVEVVNDFGRGAYGGPCPPSGVHRYFFKVYALDVENLEANSKEEFYSEVEKHKIEEAVLMGKYSKV
jgi:hypothetical protein